MSYKKCTKSELLDIIAELEKEAKDIETTCDHVSRGIIACLKALGYAATVCAEYSLYDLGDALDEVLDELKGAQIGERHELAHLLPECGSLGETEDLRNDLLDFTDCPLPTIWSTY